MDAVLVGNADVRCMDASGTRAEDAVAGARVPTTVIRRRRRGGDASHGAVTKIGFEYTQGSSRISGAPRSPSACRACSGIIRTSAR